MLAIVWGIMIIVLVILILKQDDFQEEYMRNTEIDVKATRVKAESILKDYRKFEKVAETDYVANITATYSFEPRSYTGVVGTPIQNHVERKVLAEKVVEEIIYAINNIKDTLHRALLIEKYCKHDYICNDDLMYQFFLSPATFYRKFEEALVYFAIYFKDGKNVVYKEDEGLEDYMRQLLE